MLRHGGTGRVFTGLRAATTLGTHLRGYRFGHVRQLDAVAARLLGNLARVSPILTGADQLVYVDVDDTVRETHGYRKQGAAYGYSRVKGLNAQLAIVSTPLAAPVIAATRLRKGNIDSGHGAARLIGDTLATLRTKGLITEEPDDTDRRRRLLALTPAGLDLAQVMNRERASLRTSLESMSPERKGAALDVVLTLIGDLHAQGVITVDRSCKTCRFRDSRPDGDDWCGLLRQALTPDQLRVACPEHESLALAGR